MLGNEFATLMLVSGTERGLEDRLKEAAKRLEWERRLTIFIRELESGPEQSAQETFEQFTLAAVGVDKAGIVAGISRCLAGFGILITDLRGEVQHVPQSGTPLYTLSLRMNVPQSLEIAKVESALEAIAQRVDIEVSVRLEDKRE